MISTSKRRVLTASLVTLFLLGGGALTASADDNPGGNPGTKINKLDDTSPVDTKCADSAVTVASRRIANIDSITPSNSYTTTIGTAYVRYSKDCGTNWIKVVMDDPLIKYTTYIGIYRWSSDVNVPFDQQTNRKSFGIGDTRTGTVTWGNQLYTPGHTPINLMVHVYADRYLVGFVQANIQD